MTNRITDNIKNEYDVVIIGAGINGAGVALDAVLRGLSVLLIDKNDFGGSTTSASTKLIHGGLRYLEYYEFPLVRESLRERERLLRNAPHLVKSLKLNIPIYKADKRGPLLIKLGMIFYDILSFDKSLPRHSLKLGISKKKIHQIEPSIQQDGLLAISSYYDCQVEYPERLCLELVLSAKEYGADVYNYTEFVAYNGFKDGSNNIVVRDCVKNELVEVKAKVLVNAGGPHVDLVNALVDNKITRKMGGTKGSHILIEKFDNGPIDALYVEAKQDGRPFFIIPWFNYYLVGTTDIYFEGDLDNVVATEDEIKYLLNELNYFFPSRQFNRSDVLYTYSGVRPLPYEPGKKEKAVTRKHIIYDHDMNEGLKNYISLIGGKLTTYRNLAEEAVDLICKKLAIREKTKTKTLPIWGGFGIKDIDKYVLENADKFSKQSGLSTDTVEFLIRFYGSKFKNILKIINDDSSLKEKISPDFPDIKAQVVYAIRKEAAKTLEDIVIRRTSIGTKRDLGYSAVEIVADIAVEQLNWSAEKKAEEINCYREKVTSFYLLNKSKLNLTYAQKS